MGFHAVNVTNPDGSVQSYTFYSTMGYGVATSTIAANTCGSFSGICDVDPWTDPRNALHGRMQEEDDYVTNGTTLLKQMFSQYNLTCPAPGVRASAYNTNANTQYVGQSTSEVDIVNPVKVCEITTKQDDTYMNDGGASKTGSHTTTAYSYSYDSSGHLTRSVADTSTNNAGSTPHIVKGTSTVWHDARTINSTSAVGPYLVDYPGFQDVEDGSGNRYSCSYLFYDGQPYAVGSSNNLTQGLLTEQDDNASCGIAPNFYPSGAVSS